jgi:Lhr-like helicase
LDSLLKGIIRERDADGNTSTGGCDLRCVFKAGDRERECDELGKDFQLMEVAVLPFTSQARLPLSAFHPVVERWFHSRFAGPTGRRSGVAGDGGRHTLIAAPTGSGKTLTAFLAVIDRLLRESITGTLVDELRVVYVSPLRALSNDMHRNLEVPLAEIMEHAQRQGVVVPPLRVGLRTGDTPSHKRAALVKNPPHILVTTPESLYLMLTAEKSREVLETVDTLIVDEIHALVRDKRGSHLALSVERMAALTDRPLQRIGLSATQKPIERMAEFLVGVGEPVSLRSVGFNALWSIGKVCRGVPTEPHQGEANGPRPKARGRRTDSLYSSSSL